MVRASEGKVVAALALAVLALFAPVIAVAMFGAGAITAALGPMAAGMLGEAGGDAEARRAGAQAGRAGCAQAQSRKHPSPGGSAQAGRQPRSPTAAAPKPAAEAPGGSRGAEACAYCGAGASRCRKPPEPPKSAPAPVTEPVKTTAAKPEPVTDAEMPAKAEPVAGQRGRPPRKPDAGAPDPDRGRPRWCESKIRFNDLVTAVLYRDAGAVNDLLAFGKWPDKADSTGMTPLMIAASLGETEIAEALLKAGADPQRAGPGGRDGDLHRARAQGRRAARPATGEALAREE